jgi:hypothetical protein
MQPRAVQKIPVEWRFPFSLNSDLPNVELVEARTVVVRGSPFDKHVRLTMRKTEDGKEKRGRPTNQKPAARS